MLLCSFMVRDATGKVDIVIDCRAVCYTYALAAFGVSKDKLTRARRLVAAGNTEVAHGNVHAIYGTKRNVLGRCVLFWREFFAIFCSTDAKSPGARYWSVDKCYRDIYTDHLTEWWVTHGYGRLPSSSTFIAARFDDEFANVTRRKKHRHCRCDDCHALKEQALKGFVKGSATLVEFELRKRNHKTAIAAWRACEEYWNHRAQSAPAEVNVINCDDTIVCDFPHFTLRPFKSGASLQGVGFVPWLVDDVSRGRRTYVYSLKGRWSKGANRYCTNILRTVQAIKHDVSSEARYARKLVVIGDNFSENKNNTNLCFYCEMVMAGFYDDIELLFGPVGHTHNGVDRCHFCHNRALGKYYAGTLADWINLYPMAWRDGDGTCPPGAAYCDYQYDWERHYKPYSEPLEGFMKSKGGEDPTKVCAFRITRGSTGQVEVMWKRDAVLNTPWYGINGPNSPGFIVLRSRPIRAPTSRLPEPERNNKMLERARRGVACDAIRKLCASQGTPDVPEWNLRIVETGKLPLGAAVEATESYEGRLYKFGLPGSEVHIRYSC